MCHRTAGKSVVGQYGSVQVCDHVVVSGAARVVAGEDTFELYNAVAVGLGNTAEECRIVVGQVVSVTIASSNKPRVDAGSVTVPDIPGSFGLEKYTRRKTLDSIPVEALDRLASLNIDELSLKNDRNTGLVLAEVGTNVFALDPVWSTVRTEVSNRFFKIGW